MVFLAGPPSIISEAEQYAVYNDNADIVCTANAVPKPTEVLWEKDGHPVDVEGNIRYVNGLKVDLLSEIAHSTVKCHRRVNILTYT